MNTAGLSDFIKMERSRGVSDAEIKEGLIKNNWSTNDVDMAFNVLNTPVVPPIPTYVSPSITHHTEVLVKPSNGIKKLLIVIVILLVIAAAFYYSKNSTHDAQSIKDTTASDNAASALSSQVQNSQSAISTQTTVVTTPPISAVAVTPTPTNRSTSTVKAGQKGVSLGKFYIPNQGLITNLYFSFFGTATQDGFGEFYLYENNKLIDEAYLDSSNYKPGIGPMTIASVQFGDDAGIFTGPQTVELRTDLSPTALSGTIGAKVFKLYMGEGNSISVQGPVGKEITIAGRTIILTTTDDPTPRIAMYPGNVNQHVDIAKKVWAIDPDGTSGFDIDPLTYCKKWYPNTVSVKPYETETLNNGRVGVSGEMNSEATNTIQTIECASS